MITFEQTGIREELLKAVSDLGFEIPMPVQEQVIPAILGTTNDIVGLSQTGSGKTAAYGLPLLSLMDENVDFPQIIILCPTRELCIQIAKDLTNYGKYIKNLKVVAVYGGASMDQQIKELRDGAQVIVATPGRMNDLIRRKRVNLDKISSLVLDEADEMLNMGFQEELNSILEELPKKRRTLLFSATMPREVAAIASGYMKNSVEIVIGNKNSGADTVRHYYYIVHASDRYLALKRIVDYYPEIYGIIFCRTRIETKEVAEKLMKDGYNADALHGDLSQAQREYAMQRFRLRNLQILVATDVAARGLDVEDLTHVINYNLPDDDDIYTHRSGRTGRAGKKGISISICNTRDKTRIPQLSRLIKKEFELRTIPKGEEICGKQLFNLIDKMQKVEVNAEQIDDYLPTVYKKLSTLTREELITRFVSVEFNHFLNYYKDARDLNVPLHRERDNDRDRGRSGDRGRDGSRERFDSGKRNSDSSLMLFRINLGEMDNITPPRLIGLINDNTKTRNITIGKVKINQSFTLFEADATFAELLIKSFKGQLLNNRKIDVSKANEGNRGRNTDRGDRSGDRNDRGSFRGGNKSDKGGDRPYRSESPKREFKGNTEPREKREYKERSDRKYRR